MNKRRLEAIKERLAGVEYCHYFELAPIRKPDDEYGNLAWERERQERFLDHVFEDMRDLVEALEEGDTR